MTMPKQSRSQFLAEPIAQRIRLDTIPSARIDKRTMLFWSLPIMALGLVGIVYLLLSSYIVTTTLDITQLRETKTGVVRRNAQLASEISQLESPQKIRARAEQLGLVEAQAIVGVMVTPLATLAPAPSTSAVRPPSSKSLLDILIDDFSRWMGIAK